jgi:hypothetical protein
MNWRTKAGPVRTGGTSDERGIQCHGGEAKGTRKAVKKAGRKKHRGDGLLRVAVPHGQPGGIDFGLELQEQVAVRITITRRFFKLANQ